MTIGYEIATFGKVHQVLGLQTLVQRVKAGLFQLVGVVHQFRQVIQLAAFAEGTAPGKDGSHGVGGSLLALEVLVIVTGNGAVGGLVLVFAVRAHQDRGHHGQGAKGGGHHIGHHVAVVVLAGPYEAAFTAHHAGNGIVNEGVEVLDAGGLELLLVLFLVDFLEDGLEAAVVLLGDGVLGGEPEVFLHVQGILEAAVGKTGNGFIRVVHAFDDTGAGELVDYFLNTLTGNAFEHQFGYAGLGGLDFYVTIHVAIGMTGNGDGLFPELHGRMDAGDGDGCTEHGAVQHSADGAVGALPHLVQVILAHALHVGGDGGALDGHAILLGGICRVDGHLVGGLVAVRQAQVIVLGLEVYERQDELILDHFPQNSGHFVAVHLDERRCHFDFLHGIIYDFYNSSSGSRRREFGARRR